MARLQNPPHKLRTVARQLGIVSLAAEAWYRQAGAGDPRRVAAVRCHCIAGGQLVVLKEIRTAGEKYQVGQCPVCHRVVWAPAEQ